MADSLIFIHVPKTGGKSIVRYLRMSGIRFRGGRGQSAKGKAQPRVLPRSHETATHIKSRLTASSFNAAEKFAVVRNPVDRYRSACRFLGLDPNNVTLIDRAIEREGISKVLFLPQTEMLYIKNKLSVDKLFKFEEDFPEGVYEWLKERGGGALEGEFPHRNKKEAPLPDLTEEREEWIREYYAEDFKNFGY